MALPYTVIFGFFFWRVPPPMTGIGDLCAWAVAITVGAGLIWMLLTVPVIVVYGVVRGPVGLCINR